MKTLSLSIKEISAGARIAIYGTGKRGQEYHKILSFVRPDIKIMFFLDSFKEDRDADPPIIKIDSVDAASAQIDYIIICSDFEAEITVRLRESGFIPHDTIQTLKADWFNGFMSTEEIARCVEMFKGLLKELPDELFVFDALIRLEILCCDYVAALSYSKRAIEKFPDDIWGYVGSARCFVEQVQLVEAGETYKAMIAKFPDVPAGYAGYADVLFRMNKIEEAVYAYKEMVSTLPGVPQGYLGLFQSLMFLNRLGEAEEVSSTALARFPLNQWVLRDRINVLARTGKYDQAVEVCKFVLHTWKDNASDALASILRRARYITRQERYDEDRLKLKSAVVATPGSQQNLLEKTCDLLTDDVSKDVFAHAVKFHLDRLDLMSMNASFSEMINARLEHPNCAGYISRYRHYHHPLVGPQDGDVIIDGGAYSGETSLYFFSVAKGCHIVSCEPSERFFAKMLLKTSKYKSSMSYIHKALWHEETELKFTEVDFSPMSSHIAETGDLVIQATTLDAIVKELNLERVDLIKLDIEGAEMQALLGAENTILQFHPKLQISIYHQVEDMWEIPLYIAKTFPGYSQYYVGHHSVSTDETVLYVSR